MFKKLWPRQLDVQKIDITCIHCAGTSMTQFDILTDIYTVNCFIFVSTNFCQIAKKDNLSVRKFVISGLPEHKFVTRGPFLRIVIMCLAHLTDVITCLALV